MMVKAGVWTSVSVKTIDPNANTPPTLSVNVSTLSIGKWFS